MAKRYMDIESSCNNLLHVEETFTDLNKSLEIRLNDVFALKHRGKYQEALADLNKSLEIQPNGAFALNIVEKLTACYVNIKKHLQT